MDLSPSTPFLVVDDAVLRSNIGTMAARAAAAGWTLRPHVKTHKVPRIAQLQVDAGARGITVATVGEAQVFAEAGFDDILVAYPLWLDERRGKALAAVRERASVLLGLDSVAAAEQVARHAPGCGVVVEVDSGHHRSGVPAGEAASVAVAARGLGLDVAGVFTFPGHSYSLEGRRASAQDEEIGRAHV